jgi:hypothetical protein
MTLPKKRRFWRLDTLTRTHSPLWIILPIRAISLRVVQRNRPSYMLSWLRRLEKKTPIILSSMQINDTSLLHLPAESFVQYQFRAQQFVPTRFVATASYGDGGPWYIPVKEEYLLGGYEVSVAFSEPSIDDRRRLE